MKYWILCWPKQKQVENHRKEITNFVIHAMISDTVVQII